MANYKTHRNVGIISATGFTGLAYYLSQNISHFPLPSFIESYELTKFLFINLSTIIVMFFMGVIASILPDIDLDYSKPSQFLQIFTFFMIFGIINLFFGNYLMDFLKQDIISKYINDFSLYFIYFSLIISITKGLNLFLFFILSSNMNHRGVVHSIPFALMVSLIIYQIIIYLNVFNVYLENNKIWLNAFLISLLFFIGFVTHLLLDELYSVDFKNKRLKSSWGTAMKFYDKNNITGTIILYLLIIGLYFFNEIYNYIVFHF